MAGSRLAEDPRRPCRQASESPSEPVRTRLWTLPSRPGTECCLPEPITALRSPWRAPMADHGWDSCAQPTSAPSRAVWFDVCRAAVAKHFRAGTRLRGAVCAPGNRCRAGVYISSHRRCTRSGRKGARRGRARNSVPGLLRQDYAVAPAYARARREPRLRSLRREHRGRRTAVRLPTLPEVSG